MLIELFVYRYMDRLSIDLWRYLVGRIEIFFQQTVSALRESHALEMLRKNLRKLPTEGQDTMAMFALNHKHQEASLTSGIGVACAKVCEAWTVSNMGFLGRTIQTGDLKRMFQC